MGDHAQLEAKVRRLVDANVVGIVMWNLEGVITEPNDAFLRLVQYGREDLAYGRVRWTDLTPAEWCDSDERAMAELRATGIFQTFEKQYLRKDGGRVPVLLGGRFFTPFFTTKANAMGMGLPITRSLIEGHGGRLWAEPNFSNGAVFSFTLPVATGVAHA